jgi:hypothetical protein
MTSSSVFIIIRKEVPKPGFQGPKGTVAVVIGVILACFLGNYRYRVINIDIQSFGILNIPMTSEGKHQNNVPVGNRLIQSAGLLQPEKGFQPRRGAARATFHRGASGTREHRATTFAA